MRYAATRSMSARSLSGIPSRSRVGPTGAAHRHQVRRQRGVVSLRRSGQAPVTDVAHDRFDEVRDPRHLSEVELVGGIARPMVVLPPTARQEQVRHPVQTET